MIVVRLATRAIYISILALSAEVMYQLQDRLNNSPPLVKRTNKGRREAP